VHAFYKIFFFFIRAGTKVPASFHLWNFFYLRNVKSSVVSITDTTELFITVNYR